MATVRTTDLTSGLPPDAPSRIVGVRRSVTGAVFRLLGPGPFSIGRAETCHLRIADHAASKVHAELSRRALDPHTILIRDLASQNGTRVGTRSLAAEAEVLRAGDEFSVAGERFLVLDEAMEAQVRTLSVALGYAPTRVEATQRVLAAGARGRHLIVVGAVDRRLARIARAYHSCSTRRERQLVWMPELAEFRRRGTEAEQRALLQQMASATVVVEGGAMADVVGCELRDGLAGTRYAIGTLVHVPSSDWLDETRDIWGELISHSEHLRIDEMVQRAQEVDALVSHLFDEFASGTSPVCRGPAADISVEMSATARRVAAALKKRAAATSFDRLEALLHFLFHRLQGHSERQVEEMLSAELQVASAGPLSPQPVARTTFRDWAERNTLPIDSGPSRRGRR